MAEPLIVSVSRFLDDPKAFESRLAGRCVLVYEPPEAEEDESTDANFRFRTQSGAAEGNVGGGEPVVIFLEKTKDNVMQRRVTVGRTSNNDVVLDDGSVSRFHAWFEKNEQGWWVADAGSKNGTSVSGKALPARQAKLVTSGTRVKIGSLELTFLDTPGFMKLLKTRASS